MRTLRYNSIVHFISSTIIVLIIISPLLFKIIMSFYDSDLDDLINYRIEQFKEVQQPILTHIKVDMTKWNEFDPDIAILPFDPNIELDKPVEFSTYSEHANKKISYRAKYTEITIDGKKYLLSARLPMFDDIEIIQIVAFQILVVIFCLVFTQLILYKLFANRISSPFYSILRAISTFKLNGNTIPEFKKTNITEYKYLSDKLQQLMRNAQRSYSKQKEFIENVSHEMQTPIAVVQTQLDLLLQDPRITEEQIKVIQTLYAVAAQTKRLNKNLLLLAQIENSQYCDLESIDLVKHLQQNSKFFIETAHLDEISIQLDIDYSAYTVDANFALLDILLNNLFSNAIKYNKSHGDILVTLKDDRLVFSNTSPTSTSLQLNIFDRFVKKDKSKQGYGLGLTIVKEICMLHKWSVQYEFSKEQHHFIIKFPK